MEGGGAERVSCTGAHWKNIQSGVLKDGAFKGGKVNIGTHYRGDDMEGGRTGIGVANEEGESS